MRQNTILDGNHDVLMRQTTYRYIIYNTYRCEQQGFFKRKKLICFPFIFRDIEFQSFAPPYIK